MGSLHVGRGRTDLHDHIRRDDEHRDVGATIDRTRRGEAYACGRERDAQDGCWVCTALTDCLVGRLVVNDQCPSDEGLGRLDGKVPDVLRAVPVRRHERKVRSHEGLLVDEDSAAGYVDASVAHLTDHTLDRRGKLVLCCLQSGAVHFFLGLPAILRVTLGVLCQS